MSSQDATDVSWAVVDNGLDFLKRAVSELAADDTKYATIHLFGAIEVLIKARLIREHWTLACSKADGATLSALEAGDVITVDAIPGLKRLQSNVGLAISKTHIDNVDAVRNRYFHDFRAWGKAARMCRLVAPECWAPTPSSNPSFFSLIPSSPWVA